MKKDNMFWIGYSDLMTSLFFIMLVLFVVTNSSLKSYQDIKAKLETKKKEVSELKASKKQIEKIEEIQTALKQLPKEYFKYQLQYRRFKLNKQIQFDIGSSTIQSQYNNYLIKVGHSIVDLIEKLKTQDKFKKLDIKYLVIIEGMASKDSYYRNFELSYERALSLYHLWKENRITFNAEDCEVQISGSGTDGIREYKGEDESKNQQFLIQIIPKIGEIDK